LFPNSANGFGENTFTTLVDPGREIPAKASAITGIRDEHVRGHPAFEEVLPRLLEFLAAGVITGYNIQFDLMFINNVLRSKGGPPLNPAVTLDVLSICRALKPGARDYSLEVMAREYAIPVHDRHTALGDALITARLLLCLLPELENRGVRTLRDLNYFLRYRALF
jgi:DNA polymerase-3 subunit epsilon